MLRVAAFGGGTGLPVLLRALGTIPEIEATAIVTVTDDGGSSGRLRRSFGIPAVGDLRNCLVALSRQDSVLADLFQHRFPAPGGLEGHSLGNLIVTALCQRTGSLEQAVEVMSEILSLKGRALPTTGAQATLCAEFSDKAVIRGESAITAAGKLIERIWLEPANPPASPGVLEAIEQADSIIFAPGSLYSSVLPNLLVAGVANAVRASRAVKIFVCNLLTQPGETDGFRASDHLLAIEKYLGRGVVDFCIANCAAALTCSRDPRAQCVVCDPERIAETGAIPVAHDLAATREDVIQHDPVALGRLVWEISRGWTPHAMVMRQPARVVHFGHGLVERESVCLNPVTAS